MAFDRSMLLTYVAVALVIVTGVVFCINGDFSEDKTGSGIVAGDYIEVYYEFTAGDEMKSYTARSEVVSVGFDEFGEEELLVRDYIDGEFNNEYMVSPELFMSMVVVNNLEEFEYEPTRTETVSTELGPRECYIYEAEGSTKTLVHLGVENSVIYYAYSGFEMEGIFHESIQTLVGTSFDM